MSKRAKQRQIAASSRRASRKAWLGIGVALVTVLGVGIAVFAGRSDQAATQVSVAASDTGAAPDGAVLPVVDVYKDPTCGCCSKWVEHLEAAGFTVRTTDTGDLAEFKTKHNVPALVRSCHTALVDGYVMEGHVPAADVQRFLRERPANVAGLGVPGMPIGSPGMEVAGTQAQRYDVIAFAKDGSTRVFATH
ncbi:MAG: DUF411 domain-containing protein [Acidobacteria bacterium]|nr:DUF411 domain-containing protein [Acidobacteriota bacterium]